MRFKIISGSGIILVLAVWAFITYTGMVGSLFLPTPTAVILEARKQIEDGIFFQDIWISFYRILIGFLLATLFALPIGVMMGTSKTWKAFWEPIVGFVRYMPVVAFIPLSILWFGTSDMQKFFIIFFGVFFQQVIMIADNCKTVKKSVVEVGLTLGLNRLEVIKDIVVKAAMPSIWDTLRTVWGWAWTYLVVAELVAATSGLGFRIMQAQRYLSTETIILGILTIGLLGLITDTIFGLLAKMMFPWHEKEKINN
ncbi:MULTISPECIES: ABC transporter permease [Sporolactobacillus]|uniref:NitT/TauT family transport system permease protein n=1 Tax=Sporolactobacillus nakayamae TaxID=269670 RepID=A0A1I2TZZ7_9BACL|nr:ABC transporter permease [Sporolactobacillus nakayamae]SFG70448.1 NitT/TauT family transport system permease protein [Sporolactobacillus nakayamae]